MSAAVPHTVSDFAKIKASFEAWLIQHGSAILKPTNPYEVIRFVGMDNTCVVYSDAKGSIKESHWQHGAFGAFTAFREGKAWRASRRAPVGQRKRMNTIRSIVVRDGWTCAYCPTVLTEETATIEHFVALTHGGPDHLANQMLACDECNGEASHLSAREKIEMAIRKRAKTGKTAA